MRDTVVVEDRQKPVVAAVTEEFVEHGRNIANLEGHSDMRQLVFPYLLEGLPSEDVRRIAEEMYPQFLKVIGAER
ncbi:MAG: hypothetical protein FJY55_14920 [Betaproteobacteria bacterium]|nr:hypothetical protein [Betaproteobacteria bacterium]